VKVKMKTELCEDQDVGVSLESVCIFPVDDEPFQVSRRRWQRGNLGLHHASDIISPLLSVA